jgi:hypothetical protein
LEDSNDGIRCNRLGEGVLGLGPGIGSDVDLEGGRFVIAFATGYTGRARDVIWGVLMAEAGRLGRRNSVVLWGAASVSGEVPEGEVFSL